MIRAIFLSGQSLPKNRSGSQHYAPVSLSNGNLTSNGKLAFAYDDENQLISVVATNSWKSEFVYDGLGRRRVRKEYAWQSSDWVLKTEVRYIYDGNLVIQERDGTNLPLVTYTRGIDLSGSFQGAGGIGGLLARTDHTDTASPNAYYHADAGGNITKLIDAQQLPAATYIYEPFGGLLSAAGRLAPANLYRLSSKELHANSGLYYYGYRFYSPGLQRWIRGDPIEENGGINLYRFCEGDPINYIDPDGRLATSPSINAAGLGRSALPAAANRAGLVLRIGARGTGAYGWAASIGYAAGDVIGRKTGYHDALGNILVEDVWEDAVPLIAINPTSRIRAAKHCKWLEIKAGILKVGTTAVHWVVSCRAVIRGGGCSGNFSCNRCNNSSWSFSSCV